MKPPALGVRRALHGAEAILQFPDIPEKAKKLKINSTASDLSPVQKQTYIYSLINSSAIYT
jgi:hypothetical protein